MFTKNTTLQHFVNTKSLSSQQVYWTQKLSQYYFWIEYYQSKTNRSTNIFFRYLQQNVKEEVNLRAKNTKILPWLQSFFAKVSRFSAYNISFLC